MRDQEWCNTLSFFSRRSFLRNKRSLKTISMWSLHNFSNLFTLKEVFIGKSMKSLSFGRFLNWNCVKILVEIAWPLKPTHGPLMRLGRLSGMDRLSGLECLSPPSCLSGPTLFEKPNLNHFKLKKKKKLILLIPRHNLICHKPNLFRHVCYFPIGRTTLDLQWRANHYL